MFYWTILVISALGAYAHDSIQARELQDLYESLPRHEFIKYFNRQNFSFKIKHYENLPRSCQACTYLDDTNDLPVISYDPELIKNLPENFDSREAWPHCESISDVFYQGGCGSCWAIASTSTASDRTCIHQNLTVRLSIQDLQCCEKCSTAVCNGGYQSHAFEFWADPGLVTQECKPYNEDALYKTNVCNRTCQENTRNYEKDKHRAVQIYHLETNDDAIRGELFKNGPITTGFVVYSDFEDYAGGIYEHKYGKKLDGHAVRVIGYGVEGNISYWLVANSWGKTWGQNGLFKIKRFQADLGFENNMRSGI